MSTVYSNISDVLCDGDTLSLLKLCGVAECDMPSDYDKLRCLIGILPLCVGHPVFERTSYILRAVFGIDIISSAHEPEKIWTECSRVIEQLGLTADDIPDLPDGYSSVGSQKMNAIAYKPRSVLSLKIDDSTDAGDYSSFIGLTSRAVVSCDAAEFDLHDFVFRRNSKKKEIERIFAEQVHGNITKNEYDELFTSYLIFACRALKENKKRFILLTGHSDADEIFKFYNYLRMNDSVPQTLLVTPSPEKFAGFVSEFTFSGKTPGIVVSSYSPILPRIFPVGLSEIYLPERVFRLGEEGSQST